jgi:hypothetical protein
MAISVLNIFSVLAANPAQLIVVSLTCAVGIHPAFILAITSMLVSNVIALFIKSSVTVLNVYCLLFIPWSLESGWLMGLNAASTVLEWL